MRVVDVGGTKIEGGCVNRKGRASSLIRIPTPSCRKEIIRAIALAVPSPDQSGDCVAVSLPGIVENGRLVFAGGTLSCLVGMNIQRELQRALSSPVFIANDAKCFAIGEALRGAGRGFPTVIGVVWGTGIGCGIAINNEVFEGACEIGHMVVESESCAKCGCGRTSCLESISGGRAICERYVAGGGRVGDPTPKDVFQSREELAKKVVSEAIHFLGIGIGTLVNMLSPSVIVFGGGISNAPVLSTLRREILRSSLPILGKKLKVVRHTLPNACLVGAEILARRARALKS